MQLVKAETDCGVFENDGEEKFFTRSPLIYLKLRDIAEENKFNYMSLVTHMEELCELMDSLINNFGFYNKVKIPNESCDDYLIDKKIVSFINPLMNNEWNYVLNILSDADYDDIIENLKIETLEKVLKDCRDIPNEKSPNHLYFVIFKSGKCKIGVSKNPEKRISIILNQSGEIMDKQYIYPTEKAYSIESHIKRKFKHMRIAGEFFPHSKTILNEINSLSDYSKLLSFDKSA